MNDKQELKNKERCISDSVNKQLIESKSLLVKNLFQLVVKVASKTVAEGKGSLVLGAWAHLCSSLYIDLSNMNPFKSYSILFSSF